MSDNEVSVETTLLDEARHDSRDHPNNMVKMLIWDLDHTFWSGTLSEEGILPIQSHIELVKTFSARGIVNSICSKNDFNAAKKALTNTSADICAAQEVMIGAWYAFQPARDQPARDSALAYLERAGRSPAWRRQALILMEKVFFKAGDTTRGLTCLRDAVADCKRTGDKAAEARAWNYMGSYYPYFIDVMPKRLAALDKALPLYRQLKDTANESLCLNYEGYMQVPAKNLKLSKEFAGKAMRLQQAYHFPYVHYVEDLLGYIDIATYTKKETLELAMCRFQRTKQRRHYNLKAPEYLVQRADAQAKLSIGRNFVLGQVL